MGVISLEFGFIPTKLYAISSSMRCGNDRLKNKKTHTLLWYYQKTHGGVKVSFSEMG